MAQKFRRGGPGASLEVDYQIHVALLVSHQFTIIKSSSIIILVDLAAIHK